MSILIILILVILFIIADLIIRLVLKKIRNYKIEKERKEALEISLKLDYTDEANSLKRVEIENPKAKILAVDDEEIILDSFRKILVVGGYSVDTVLTGKEAIGLVRKNDYDFVFTDLKMPEVDGLDVSKAVRHLRPDIDVIIITGYATVESAVDAMKFGVMDYVQKPFTEDELLEFANKLLIKRQDRIENNIKPAVNLVTPITEESDSSHKLNIPSGLFISENHTWLKIEMNGLVRIGIDEFVLKSIGKIEDIMLPQSNSQINRGDSFSTLIKQEIRLNIQMPINGKIIDVNQELKNQPEFLTMRPYVLGWICTVNPSNLSKDLCDMRIGTDSASWYQNEINKLMKILKTSDKNQQSSKDSIRKQLFTPEMWKSFSNEFMILPNKSDEK